jgi:hypothetical protein
MIDPKSEELLTVKQAAQLPELHRNGRPIHFATVWRWIAQHKLDVLKVGGVTLTSREAVSRMIAQANPGVTIPTTSPRERKRQIDSAERRLAACGV